MNDPLSDLLHDSTPEPPRPVSLDAVARGVRRRRTTTGLVGAGAVLAVIGLTAGGVAWFGDAGAPEGREPEVVGEPEGGTSDGTPTGCPALVADPGRHADIHWVDFLHVGKQQFLAGLDEVTPQPVVGGPLGSVNCTIADLPIGDEMKLETEGAFLDGNAAYLPVGTSYYAVAGFDDECRLGVVLEDGEVVSYLAHHEVDGHSRPLPCALTPTDGLQVTVSTHCGVVSAWVDGRLWIADPPLGDHNPPAGWDENSEVGTFRITGGTATFTTDDGLTASFRRAAAKEKDPNEGCE